MYNSWQEKSMISFSGKLWASFISQHPSVIFTSSIPHNLTALCWSVTRGSFSSVSLCSLQTSIRTDPRSEMKRTKVVTLICALSLCARYMTSWQHSEVALFRKMWHSLRAVKDGVRISFYWHFVRVTPSSAFRLTAAQKCCGSEVHSVSFSCWGC